MAVFPNDCIDYSGQCGKRMEERDCHCAPPLSALYTSEEGENALQECLARVLLRLALQQLAKWKSPCFALCRRKKCAYCPTACHLAPYPNTDAIVRDA